MTNIDDLKYKTNRVLHNRFNFKYPSYVLYIKSINDQFIIEFIIGENKFLIKIDKNIDDNELLHELDDKISEHMDKFELYDVIH